MDMTSWTYSITLAAAQNFNAHENARRNLVVNNIFKIVNIQHVITQLILVHRI